MQYRRSAKISLCDYYNNISTLFLATQHAQEAVVMIDGSQGFNTEATTSMSLGFSSFQENLVAPSKLSVFG